MVKAAVSLVDKATPIVASDPERTHAWQTLIQ